MAIPPPLQDNEDVGLSSHRNSINNSNIGSLPQTKKDIIPLKLYIEECKRERLNRTIDLVKDLD